STYTQCFAVSTRSEAMSVAVQKSYGLLMGNRCPTAAGPPGIPAMMGCSTDDEASRSPSEALLAHSARKHAITLKKHERSPGARITVPPGSAQQSPGAANSAHAAPYGSTNEISSIQ